MTHLECACVQLFYKKKSKEISNLNFEFKKLFDDGMQ